VIHIGTDLEDYGVERSALSLQSRINMSQMSSRLLTAIGFVLLTLPTPGGAANPPQPRVNPTAATEVEFRKRVDAYMQLHKKLEATLPKLPDNATPQQIDQNQRAMGNLVAHARATAKPGDIFFPDMQRLIHRLFAEVFSGKAGEDAKKYIHDEPHPVNPEIN